MTCWDNSNEGPDPTFISDHESSTWVAGARGLPDEDGDEEEDDGDDGNDDCHCHCHHQQGCLPDDDYDDGNDDDSAPPNFEIWVVDSGTEVSAKRCYCT